MNKKYKAGALTVLIGALTACGGGGSSAPSAATPSTPSSTSPSTQELTIGGDLSPSVNQTMALVATLEGDMSELATIKWSQTSGPAVEMIAANTAVLAFDLTTAGSYSFKVDYTTVSGVSHSKSVNFNSTQQAQPLNVRRDHVVREGNKVSFKLSAPVDPDTGNVVSGQYGAMTWVQTAGPTVAFNTENTNLMTQLFTAPQVTKDTLLSFTVTAQHPNGLEYQDQVHLLVQDTPAIVNDALFDTTVAKVRAYNANSPWAQGLEDCVYNNDFSFANRCSISKLPLIGQLTMNPSVADIMDRVVVSHPWMGDSFKKFLENEDPSGDFRSLLRSVNAIVLSYDIRPSFYWSATGAIYLDPENLWLTPAQRDVIDVAPDYRSAFGKTLQYIMPWRYVKNNNYASGYYPSDLRISRTTFDLITDLGSLMYHELAHANDIFPSDTFRQISGATIADESYQRRNAESTVSDKLLNAFPKSSSEMAALAQVNFHGETATAEQESYLASDITNFFSNDVAPVEYAYSSTAEDTATLFDATMMSARFGIDRDVAVTDYPDNATGLTITVDWGQRGRVNAPGVAERVKFVLDNLMPEVSSTDIMASLPAVKQLPPNYNWIEVLNPDNPSASDKRSLSPRLGDSSGVSERQRPLALDLKSNHQ